MDIRKEIDEAVNAANDALFHLMKADEYLDSARNWGIFDMLGGRFIASFAKHSKMKDAQQELRYAGDALSRLNRELRDVNMYLDVDIETDNLLGFADTFFDSFIFDIMTQQRIADARRQVKNAIESVDGVLDALGDIASQGDVL